MLGDIAKSTCLLEDCYFILKGLTKGFHNFGSITCTS